MSYSTSKSIIIFLLISVFSIPTGRLLAQEGFETYDLDGSGYVDNVEYDAAVRETQAFDYWDSDDDGLMEAEEYTSGVREIYDHDDDMSIDRVEWDRPRPYSRDLGDWDTYDQNMDGVVDEQEWDAASSEMTFDSAYDEDGDSYLNESEYSKMTYDYADSDGDNRLDRNEFNSLYE